MTVNTNGKKPKKPIIFYYLIALGVLLLLNAIVFPQYLGGKFVEVDYGTFLSMVDGGSVKQAVVDNNTVRFIAEDKDGRLYTTGTARTGCMFCMFGVHREKEPNRFQKMKETHPKIYEYCMRPIEENGLGLDKVLNFLGVPH